MTPSLRGNVRLDSTDEVPFGFIDPRPLANGDRGLPRETDVPDWRWG